MMSVTYRWSRDEERATGQRLIDFVSRSVLIRVTHGMLLSSHRAEDPERSLPYLPFHPHATREPLAEGEKAKLRIGLLASATLFRVGDGRRIDLQGHWFHDRDRLRGLA
jgi:predicted acyl esterase